MHSMELGTTIHRCMLATQHCCIALAKASFVTSSGRSLRQRHRLHRAYPEVWVAES